MLYYWQAPGTAHGAGLVSGQVQVNTNTTGFASIFYVPERPFMHFTDSCLFLISFGF